MKKLSGFLMIAAIVIFSACNSGPKGERAETGEAEAKPAPQADAVDYFIDTTYSIIEWTGSKPTGQHHGTINIRDGFLKVVNNEVVGGEIYIDMYSIDNIDLKGTENYDKLVGHLKSEDFWDVNTYPSSLFQITNVTAVENPDMSSEEVLPTHRVTGNLTMLDSTKSITFGARIEIADHKIVAETPQFIIDRTNWGIKYKSKTIFEGLEDNFISDDIGLKIKILASEKGQL